jgi:hypothetical protein
MAPATSAANRANPPPNQPIGKLEPESPLPRAAIPAGTRVDVVVVGGRVEVVELVVAVGGTVVVELVVVVGGSVVVVSSGAWVVVVVGARVVVVVVGRRVVVVVDGRVVVVVGGAVVVVTAGVSTMSVNGELPPTSSRIVYPYEPGAVFDPAVNVQEKLGVDPPQLADIPD